MSNLSISNLSNLNNMSTEELLELKAAIEEELQRRTEKEKEMCLYEHDCCRAASYHRSKHKHWCKVVRAVDISKTDGYAFIGDFLPVERQHRVPVGSVVVEVCGDKIAAYRITQQGKEIIAQGTKKEMISFIEKVAAALK